MTRFIDIYIVYTYYYIIGFPILLILKCNEASAHPVISISLRCPPNYPPLIDSVLFYRQTIIAVSENNETAFESHGVNE